MLGSVGQLPGIAGIADVVDPVGVGAELGEGIGGARLAEPDPQIAAGALEGRGRQGGAHPAQVGVAQQDIEQALR